MMNPMMMMIMQQQRMMQMQQQQQLRGKRWKLESKMHNQNQKVIEVSNGYSFLPACHFWNDAFDSRNEKAKYCNQKNCTQSTDTKPSASESGSGKTKSQTKAKKG